MASNFTTYRNPNTKRTNNPDNEGSKDLKHNIRESRWIQPEDWQAPNVEEKFKGVSISDLIIRNI